MAIALETIKTLAEAGFGKPVAAINALVTFRNQMAGDAELKAWAGWTAEDFETNLGVSASVSATMVAAMSSLKACYLKIVSQPFPPDAV